ncbi:PQQ-dependent sugar dehydrogenase [Hyphomicrobium sp.]|uniref:PQQ-dependent sugar dehydrogenase n=1 Tax=Hyphomicrobium sp. TaxID=82 RepID=UPI002D76EF38|nr:PQQ-dependent sugar dehydrogenase [Hyphomicrobium sp.]HET6390898.1 PQQ-dependent sugar dehydrogenase [Hyphomicrobium sp.]
MGSALGRLGFPTTFATAFVAALLLQTPQLARAEIGSDETPAGSFRPQVEIREMGDDEFPFELRKIADKLESPWAMAFLPDGRMLVTERPGRLRVIEGDQLVPRPIGGVPTVLAASHSGLLDILVDPDFLDNRRIFLSYMHGTDEAATIRIASAVLDGWDLVDKQVIFESRPAAKGLDQIGGRLAFGPDKALYLTIGDRFQKERSQNLLDHGGKIIRIKTDGSIPEDNPFVGRSDVLPEIYSYGHRNPQGLIGNVGDGQLWSIEQGPKGGDELNLVTAGSNYGWPVVTYGVDYDDSIISNQTSAPGMVDPVYVWVPSLATASLVSYYGNVMPDDWRGDFLVGSLAGECLVRLRMDSGRVVKEERYLHNKIGRIRDVKVAPDGYIYLLTDSSEASIYRIEPLTDQVARVRSVP